MMNDESLHLQVKTIETELSRAQSCLAHGDVHASQLHQLFAMSSFLATFGALGRSGATIQQTGKLGRRKAAQVDAVPMTPEPVPAPSQTPQTPPVRQSLRWEHVPDDFGGKMCLFIGAFDIIGIQQDEDDNERAFYYPTTGWYSLENIVYHPPSQYHSRVEKIDQLMRTQEQAMRWTEEQLKLPILPTWLNGEQVTLAAHPEPQEPCWKESEVEDGHWMLLIGSHKIAGVYTYGDDDWYISGVPTLGPFDFNGARATVEGANRLHPCRVIR